jgi:putative DNA primase/helicase
MSPWKDELCCDVAPAALDWLWPRYLARGKLVILDGDPGMGKSVLTIALIARLTRGGALPDGVMLTRPYTCVLLSAEDAAADTIRPRAEAAGVDLARLVVPNFGQRVPRFPEDLAALEGLIRERGAELVVIDPLMAFLPPKVAANLDQCVRQALTPLATIAAETGCAILLVRHLTKTGRDRAVHRGQGSMGIVASVRTALFVAPHPQDPNARVLAVSKSNVGQAPPALGFRVVELSGQPAIEWTGPVEVTADDVSQTRRVEVVRMRDRACDWLKRALAGGPRTAADLYAAAAKAGIPERSLDRAKQSLGIGSQRIHNRKTDRSEWYWYDSSAPWPQDAPFKKPFELEPLDALDPL